MSRRQKDADKIIHAISESNLGICANLCFKCLYGLPSNLQINLSIDMLKRYLDIFENRNQNITTPRILLNGLEDWSRDHKMEIEGQDADYNSADSAFFYGLESVLVAYVYQETEDLLATSCACAIKSVVNAFGSNVWEADDPICVKKWRKGENVSKESVLHNVASIAVESREWKAFVTLLEKSRVYSYDDKVDVNKMNELLDEWIDNEMLLMMHLIRDLND